MPKVILCQSIELAEIRGLDIGVNEASNTINDFGDKHPCEPEPIKHYRKLL
jgi:hypothetical protein